MIKYEGYILVNKLINLYKKIPHPGKILSKADEKFNMVISVPKPEVIVIAKGPCHCKMAI